MNDETRPPGGTKRAFGRALGDFRIAGATTPNGLLPAEERLLVDVARGDFCSVSDLDWKKPEDLGKLKNDTQFRIRAGFLRFLALGGDEAAPVHEKGVRFEGAYIKGDLDLESCQPVVSLHVANSYFAGSLTLRDAHIRGLNLRRSRVGKISGDRAKIDGSIFLQDGFTAEGEVRFLGVSIGGDLDCSQSCFNNPDGNALACDRAVVTGSVFLSDGFVAKGEVRLLAAEIGGVLSCIGGRFTNAAGDALSCDGAKIKGDVFLRKGFVADGAVRLHGAEIGGDLGCNEGSFRSMRGDALACDRAKITGGIYLRDGFTAEGTVSFLGAYAQNLADDDITGGTADACRVALDGFTYERIARGASTFADKRIPWLLRQVPDPHSIDFCPQPFEQLAKVLAAMGHDDDARKVAMEKQRLMIPVRYRDAPWYAKPFVRPLWKLHGLTSGFGYRPSRLIVILIALWLAGGLFFAKVAEFGAFEPADRQVRADQTLRMCRHNWTQCDAANIIQFWPLGYSADNLLPAIDLGQRKAWVVAGWVATLAAIQSFLGVMGALLFGAIVTGLIKKD